MLSTRQAHHIPRLADRHDAQMVFAGDTRQQQPVEAGPGLRLIRDAIGSVRVDRIRRQRPDLEDILVHAHGGTPPAARFRAGLMGEEERTRILSDYEAMADKPAFSPWQVAVSEALRDGDAAQAIQEWHERSRFHLGFNEERTLRALVDEWERYTRQHPGEVERGAGAHAGGGAGSLSSDAGAPVCGPQRRGRCRSQSRDGPCEPWDGGRPHRLAARDRRRRPSQDQRHRWEKQPFNGTVVTVEELKVLRHEAGTGPARGGPGSGEPSDESPVVIAARTDDGRRVSFRHNEIRDWYGNIRLDHGYTMTIAAAQG